MGAVSEWRERGMFVFGCVSLGGAVEEGSGLWTYLCGVIRFGCVFGEMSVCV